MPIVDQMLRAWAKTRGNPPFWVVEKDYPMEPSLAFDFQHNITNSTLTIAKKAKFAA
jgi:hypothetical protein